MRKLLPLVALAAALAGCVGSDHPNSSSASAAKTPAAAVRTPRGAATGLAAIRARVVHGDRYASLPDRGELLAYTAGAADFRTQAYTWKQVHLSEAHALDAIGGTMTVESPDGHLIRLRYDHHVEHPNGDWTWVGRPAGAKPGTEALITFGEKAVFGSIPDGAGPPLRIMQANGVSWMVKTDAAALASLPAAHPSGTDAIPIPHAASRPAADAASPASAAAPTSAAASPAASTAVDLVLGYTTGFAARLGGQSQANTRLNNMVDFANQAYQNSGIDARVRLVNTIQVDYADNTDNDQALYDLTGYDCSGSGSCVRRTIPASLQPLRNARDKYGADLMSLVRNFDNTMNGSCGVGWILGGGQTPIDSSDAAWAMSVVSDSNGRGSGSFPSGGYVCRDETLAHEMGHNMGAQHDVAAAKGDNGVLDANEYGRFAYSFGYKTDASNGNFYTVMAYGDSGQNAYRVFSNPRTATCSLPGEAPHACGTSDADNAQTLNQTIPVIATFRGTVIPVVMPSVGDGNADGRADIFWQSPGSQAFQSWLMNGAAWSYSAASNVGSQFRVAAIGDFDGDNRADIVWYDTSKTQLWMWRANADGSYAVVYLRSYPAGWEPVSVADANGDGRADIFWHNPGAQALQIWYMNGSSWNYSSVYAIASQYRIASTGDFNGDGYADVLWRDTSNTRLWQWQAQASGASYSVIYMRDYPPGWSIVGTGDLNADGRADVLWHSPSQQAVQPWYMQGASWTYGTASSIPSQYHVATTGDFDGDGRMDILWADSTSVWNWLSTAGGGFSVNYLRSYPSGWYVWNYGAPNYGGGVYGGL
ncbi:FG-GAP-like repeat-containing protein [Lysobacter sp. HA18]